ncbi:MAG: molybdopterin oxidoreductase family protein, partial [Nonomuraea sp.]|nr:molybdopterin oxidoreductase family protein [Nonomuraea sp.]
RRVDAAPPVLLAGLGRARDELLSAPGGELLLIGRRHLRDDNSWLHNSARLVKGRPRHQLLMHPADLDARGLADGGRALVRSCGGEVTVDVRASEDVMPGVVSLPHGYGHALPGVRLSVATTLDGASANDLTDPARLDELSGTAALNGVPVTVEPA